LTLIVMADTECIPGSIDGIPDVLFGKGHFGHIWPTDVSVT